MTHDSLSGNQNATHPSRRQREPTLLDLRHLTVSFDDRGRRAVDDVSITIPRGAFVSIVGESGSGKTTLLRAINGLTRPSSGSVLIDARDLAGLPGPALRRTIGYVIQNIGLFPHMTVADNIAVVPRLESWSKDRVAARVAELLVLVGLGQEYAARFPETLSGGQKQRVGVARALAAEPRIVLMDEPFGALDPLTRDRLGQAYRAIHDRLGLTTVMVTHDMQEAALLGDRIIVMNAGRVVCDGKPRDLLGGAPIAEVADLLSLPRRQAERIRTMLGAPGDSA